jgi:hypothetical protein
MSAFAITYCRYRFILAFDMLPYQPDRPEIQAGELILNMALGLIMKLHGIL